MVAKFEFRDTDTYTVIRYRGGKKQREHDWLQERLKGIGGADAAAVMHLSPWTSPYALWQVKTGAKKPEDISGKWVVQRGHALEAALRDRFAAQHKADGWKVTDGTLHTLKSKARPYMLADLDGVIAAPNHKTPGVLEIKTASRRDDWDDGKGGYQIPLYYLTQVTHYMAVTGWDWGYVYVAFALGDPVEIQFERDEDDINAVLAAENAFWSKVESKTPPEPTTAAEVREEVPEDDGKTVDLDGTNAQTLDDLAQQLQAVKKDIKESKQIESDLTDQLALMIGGNKAVRTTTWQATMSTRHYKATPQRVIPAKPAHTIRGAITIKKLTK